MQNLIKLISAVAYENVDDVICDSSPLNNAISDIVRNKIQETLSSDYTSVHFEKSSDNQPAIHIDFNTDFGEFVVEFALRDVLYVEINECANDDFVYKQACEYHSALKSLCDEIEQILLDVGK